MAPRRIWIMDGHNMIFAVPPLRELQLSGRREEARAGLEEHLERFATQRGEKVLLVFDGIPIPADRESGRRPLFEVVYTRGGEGGADVRIIREARAGSERGVVVTVVTNDVSTLARKLPREVRHCGVEDFWLKHIDKRRAEGGGGENDKRVEADISDMEREMLAQAAAAEPAIRVREPVPRPARAGRGTVAAPGPAAGADSAGEGDKRDRMRLKRERGRLRQERRLRRYATPRRPR